MTIHRFTTRRRRGAQALELGLIMPVLLAFLLGIFEYGYYFNQALELGTLARQTARDASMAVGADDAELQARAVEFLGSHPTGSKRMDNLTIMVETVGNEPNQMVQVILREQYPGITGYVPTPAVLNAQLVVRRETQL